MLLPLRARRRPTASATSTRSRARRSRSTRPRRPRPALTPSTAGTSLYYPGTGTTVWFKPGAGNTNVVTITATSSEPDTAISAWSFPTLAGFSLAGSNGVRTYTASAPLAGDGGNGNVTATNTAGLTSGNGSFSLTADSSAPAGGSVSGVPAYDTDGTYSFTVATDTDGQSGVASQALARERATLAGDSCTTWVADGAVSIAATVNQTTLAGPSCYRYVLTSTDNVGNVHTITSSPVKVDNTAPSTPTLALSAAGSGVYYPGAGTTAYFRPGAGATNTIGVTGSSTDADTSVASWTFPAIAGLHPGGSGATRTVHRARPRSRPTAARATSTRRTAPA